jgi:hypothetical protein
MEGSWIPHAILTKPLRISGNAALLCSRTGVPPSHSADASSLSLSLSLDILKNAIRERLVLCCLALVTDARLSTGLIGPVSPPARRDALRALRSVSGNPEPVGMGNKNHKL